MTTLMPFITPVNGAVMAVVDLTRHTLNSDPSGFPQRLKDAMHAERLKNPAVAAAVGVHPGTVSYWRSGTQRPSTDDAWNALARALGVKVAWLRDGEGPMRADSIDEASERGYATPIESHRVIHERPVSPPPRISADARAFILEFQAEAARNGAGEEELDFIRRSMTDPAAYVLYEGGRPRELTEEEVLTEMRALAIGLRAWLDIRLRQRRQSAKDA